jgi:hypothetical protein
LLAVADSQLRLFLDGERRAIFHASKPAHPQAS